ncbi:hypothetical protein [Stutzerimonas azotifigens]|uniref:hypothetical protein n=1 Tax=Stutzerimonas azotifigens TaxID=291995 RepID=UPI0004214C4B|nr:hypothetical protein [Stutzerimonas azotifigens]
MNRNVWLVVLALLILLSAIVPYTLLTEVAAWYGAFLFWCLIGVLVIVANAMLTRDWGDE